MRRKDNKMKKLIDVAEVEKANLVIENAKKQLIRIVLDELLNQPVLMEDYRKKSRKPDFYAEITKQGIKIEIKIVEDISSEIPGENYLEKMEISCEVLKLYGISISKDSLLINGISSIKFFCIDCCFTEEYTFKIKS